VFNDQLKEALKNLLMNKYAGMKAAPIMPGLAEGTAALNAVRSGIQKLPSDWYDPQPEGPTPVPDAPPPTPQTAPAMPPVAPPTPPVAPVAAAPTPSVGMPTPPAAPAMPQTPPPAAPQVPQLSGQYNDAARQQLYAQLAKKRTENAGWAAAGSLGDMAERMGGGTPMNTQQTILTQGNKEDQNAREQFEAGKRGEMEDLSTGLALKKAGREETEYGDQNNPNSQMSKLAVSLAQKYSPNEAKANGWVPGKTSYADVIKVLPIMEKGIALESAKANREMTVGLKTQQDDENRLAKLGEAMSTEKMRSGSVGQMSQSLAGIGKLKALMTGYKGDLTSQEWQEAAIAWNRILTQGGTGGGEHSIEALVPHSLRGNIQKEIQWLTNEPTGTAQQEFAKRLGLGMDREEKYATQYINKYKVGRLMDFQDVAGRHADDVRMKLESQGIGFQDVAAVNPGLASKLWPQGASAGASAPAAPAAGGEARRARIAQLKAELGK
jgi:hypothetical protein